MKKLFYIIAFCALSVGADAQRNSGGSKIAGFYPTLYQHLSQAPSTSNPPVIVCVADSINSTTIPTGMYEIDSLGRHGFVLGTSGGGGGAGMAIGGAVTSGTPGSVLYIDGSNNLAQTNTGLFYDLTNQALGVGNGSPISDVDITHNESGNRFPGLMIDRYVSGAGGPWLTFLKDRGSRSSPSGVTAGDTLGAVYYRSWNGSIQQACGGMWTVVTGTPTGTTIPTQFEVWTNTVGSPSVPTKALWVDNAQSTHLVHANGGSGLNPNAIYSIWDIAATEPNLTYGSMLSLSDLSGQAAGNGARLLFNTEYSATSFVGGAVIKGYKANSTSGDYSAQLVIQTRLNGNAQADAARFTQNQHTLLGGQAYTADSSAVLQIIPGTSTVAQVYLPPGTIMTTPQNGALTHVNGHLWFTDQGTNYDLLAGAGATPTLQQVLTAGGTLTSNHTITLGGNTLALSGLVGPPSTFAAIVHSTASDSGTYQVPMSYGSAIASTYVPTLTNTTNITTSTLETATFTRVANTVHANIGVLLTATTSATATVLTFTLPVTTSNGSQLYVGSAAIETNAGATPAYTSGIISIVSTTTGTLTFLNTTSVGSGPVNIIFDYSL